MRSTLLVMLVLAACGGSSATPDAGPGAPDAAPSCQDLVDRYTALVDGLSTQCDGDSDCAALGGKDDGAPGCDCAPALPDRAANPTADEAATVRQVEETFYAQCTDPVWFGDCDVSPAMARCSNHVCVSYNESCFSVDAGP